MKKDLTVGNPLKVILLFSIPILIGNIFQQVYNMSDTIIVGNVLGLSALSAVGSTGSMVFLVLGFASGITSGVSVVTAQNIGAKDDENVRKSIISGALVSFVIGVILSVVGYYAAMPLLEILETPSDIIEMAYDYISIIFLGLIITMFYNLLSSILRALGDSKTPLYFLIIAAILNIILDIVFITIFSFGVKGVAIATVFAQFISGLLCLIYSFKKFEYFKFKRSDFNIPLKMIFNQIYIGLPMALQYSITSIGMLILQMSLSSFVK